MFNKEAAERLRQWGQSHPGAVIWVLASVACIPGLWALLPSFDVDPDMVYVAPTIMSYGVGDLYRLFTETAPWGDGSYRPFVFLTWWFEGAIFGNYAPGWGFVSWLMGVACAALTGLVTLRVSGSQMAALTATLLVSLRQSTSWQLPGFLTAVVGALLLLLSIWWLFERVRKRRIADALAALLSGLGILWVLIHVEWVFQDWVPWYVGGLTCLQGAVLHLGLAHLAWRYADFGRPGTLAAFCGLWGVMAWSYEQPLCLPLAMAPAFLITVPRSKWHRALTLLLGAVVLTAGYVAVRWYFLQLHGMTEYQAMQLRSGSIWLVDILRYTFPPVEIVGLVWCWTSPIALLVGGANWGRITLILAWLWAYALPLRRHKQLAVLYWWKIIAYLPLVRFHHHPHYSYLPQLAAAAAHGVLVAYWYPTARALFKPAGADEPVDGQSRGVEN